LFSVKINKLETLRSNLHKKMKSVDVSTMNPKKETASIIHVEHAFASAKIEGMLKRNKAAVEQERNGNPLHSKILCLPKKMVKSKISRRQ
jgi:hypothetical protein